ncbi:MAG: hypothetical protein KAH18_03680 [Psychromonas sp.]|nr:hypothetical protein [Psychromonas sp.]
MYNKKNASEAKRRPDDFDVMSKSMKRAITIVSLFISSFSLASDMSFEQGEARWKEIKDKDSFIQYSEKVLEYLDGDSSPSLKGCKQLSAKDMFFITVINENGKVTEFIPRENTAKNECYKEKLLAISLPKPPFSPLYTKRHLK